jgi:hypothetical protein
MAFIHGKKTLVVAGGVDLSPFCRGSTGTDSTEVSETTTYGVDDKTYIPSQSDGSISLDCLFDGDVGAIDEFLQESLGAAAGRIITRSQGRLAGAPAELVAAELLSMEPGSPVANVVTLSADWQADGGFDVGRLLLDSDVDDAAGPDIDFGGDEGPHAGVVNVHAVDNTRDGTTTVTIEHSDDDTTYVELAEFVFAAGTNGVERVAPDKSSDPVRRYVRATVTRAGSTGTVRVVAAAARRIND